jgi:hypothetical protein
MEDAAGAYLVGEATIAGEQGVALQVAELRRGLLISLDQHHVKHGHLHSGYPLPPVNVLPTGDRWNNDE